MTGLNKEILIYNYWKTLTFTKQQQIEIQVTSDPT